MKLDLDADDLTELADAVADRVLQRLADVVLPEPAPAPAATASTWLTTTEAARYLGLGKSTLEIWRMAGKGPTFTKAGGRVRYARSDLDAWQRGASS
jgi:excisionase family DNA binding protein